MSLADMQIREVTSLRDYLVVMRIRNECRHFMTRDQRRISIFKQFRYWRITRREPDAHVYLGYATVTHVMGFPWRPVAYGIVGGNEIAGGVIEKARGLGYGRQMFSFLTNKVAKPGYLEVLEYNHRAHDLYKSLGWKDTGMKDGKYGHVITMQRGEHL